MKKYISFKIIILVKYISWVEYKKYFDDFEFSLHSIRNSTALN